MSTLTKEEYLAKTGKGLQPGFGPTTDFTDPQLGATAQSEGGIPDQDAGLPGQVFDVAQLPNPDVALAYGLPPVAIPEHLILGDDASDALKAQGPDSLDLVSTHLREELGDPAMAFDGTHVTGGADAQLEVLNSATGVSTGVNADGESVKVDGTTGETGTLPVTTPVTTTSADGGGDKDEKTQEQPAADTGDGTSRAEKAAKAKSS